MDFFDLAGFARTCGVRKGLLEYRVSNCVLSSRSLVILLCTLGERISVNGSWRIASFFVAAANVVESERKLDACVFKTRTSHVTEHSLRALG